MYLEMLKQLLEHQNELQEELIEHAKVWLNKTYEEVYVRPNPLDQLEYCPLNIEADEDEYDVELGDFLRSFEPEKSSERNK